MIYLNDIKLSTFLKYFNETNTENDNKYINVTKPLKSNIYIHSFSNNSDKKYYNYTGISLLLDGNTLNTTHTVPKELFESDKSKALDIYDASYADATNIKESIKLSKKQFELYDTLLYAMDSVEEFMYTPFEFCAKIIKKETIKDDKHVSDTNGSIITVSGEYSYYRDLNAIYAEFIDNSVILYDLSKIDIDGTIDDYHDILTTTNDIVKTVYTYKQIFNDNNVYYDSKINNAYLASDTNNSYNNTGYIQYELYDNNKNICGYLYKNNKVLVNDYKIINDELYIKLKNTKKDNDNGQYYSLNNIPKSQYARYSIMLNNYKNNNAESSLISLDNSTIIKYLKSSLFTENSLIAVKFDNTTKLYIRTNNKKTCSTKSIDITESDDISLYAFADIDKCSEETDFVDVADVTSYIDIINSAASELGENDTLNPIKDLDIYNTTNADVINVRDMTNPSMFKSITLTSNTIGDIINHEMRKDDSIIELLKSTTNAEHTYYVDAELISNRGHALTSTETEFSTSVLELLIGNILSSENMKYITASKISDSNFYDKQYMYNKSLLNIMAKISNNLNSQQTVNNGIKMYFDINGNQRYGFYDDEYLMFDDYLNTNNISAISVSEKNIADEYVISDSDIENLDIKSTIAQLHEYELYQLKKDRLKTLKNNLVTNNILKSINKTEVLNQQIKQSNLIYYNKTNNFNEMHDRLISFFAELYKHTSTIVDINDTATNSIDFFIDSYNTFYKDALSDNMLVTQNSEEINDFKIVYSNNIDTNKEVFKNILEMKAGDINE